MNKVLLQTCGLFMTVSATALAAPVENGGFETGNFSGWTLQMAKPIPGSTARATPEGWAAVDSSLPGPTAAESGRDFAALSLAGTVRFCGGAGLSSVDLSQTLSLDKGDLVTGWALISTPDDLISSGPGDSTFRRLCASGCSLPRQESAWVRILGGAGDPIANPWTAVIDYGAKASICNVQTGTWQFWRWQAPATGSYTIDLGTMARKRAPFSSEACFDDIQVQPVPEPGPIAYLVVGFGLFAAAGIRRS